jgi:hypothetical protein
MRLCWQGGRADWAAVLVLALLFRRARERVRTRTHAMLAAINRPTACREGNAREHHSLRMRHSPSRARECFQLERRSRSRHRPQRHVAWKMQRPKATAAFVRKCRALAAPGRQTHAWREHCGAQPKRAPCDGESRAPCAAQQHVQIAHSGEHRLGLRLACTIDSVDRPHTLRCVRDTRSALGHTTAAPRSPRGRAWQL